MTGWAEPSGHMYIVGGRRLLVKVVWAEIPDHVSIYDEAFPWVHMHEATCVLDPTRTTNNLLNGQERGMHCMGSSNR